MNPMNRYGTIYKITNTINNKVYIGQTINPNPFRRATAHFRSFKWKDLISVASRKYGKNVMRIDLIFTAFDQESLDLAEQTFIKDFNSLQPNGYNIQLGGKGRGAMPDEMKISNGLKIANWYKNNQHPFKGKKFSTEHIKQLSKVRKGFSSPARLKVQKQNIEGLKKPIIAIEIISNKSYKFNSLEDCAKELNLTSSCISRVLNKKQNRSQHKGFTFKFLDKQEEE